jgi:hypothetical protein
MRRRRLTAPRGLTTVTLAALIGPALLLASPQGPALAATDRPPDLRMAKLSDFRIVVTSTGRRLIRFTSMMTNRGAGPFAIRSTRSSTSSSWAVRQVIRTSDGGTRSVATSATMGYGGDGHGHWHVERMVDIDLWSASRRAKGSKIGFCFFDTTAVDLGLPGAPSSPVYRESWCARQYELKSVMGISVGWGDKYQSSLPFQWVDITGLPGGTYTIRAFVDARNLFLEGSNANNCTYSRISFGSSGSSVSMLGSGLTCETDYAGSAYAADISWAISTGIMPLCGILLFCPNDYVTRGQMARFIDRAVDLPETSTDFFTDDEGSPDEPAINRVAAAKINAGCGGGRFCPDRLITRGDTATFLARAYTLPRASRDYFTDDETSPNEDHINRAYEAGIMTGCGGTSFCPTKGVTRAELASFLHRAET